MVLGRFTSTKIFWEDRAKSVKNVLQEMVDQVIKGLGKKVLFKSYLIILESTVHIYLLQKGQAEGLSWPSVPQTKPA